MFGFGLHNAAKELASAVREVINRHRAMERERMEADEFTGMLVADCVAAQRASAAAHTKLSVFDFCRNSGMAPVERRKLQKHLERKEAELKTLQKAVRDLLMVWVEEIASHIKGDCDLRDPLMSKAKGAARMCRDALALDWTMEAIDSAWSLRDDPARIARAAWVVDADRLFVKAKPLADTEWQDIWQVKLLAEVGVDGVKGRRATLHFATPKGCDRACGVIGVEWAILSADWT